MEVKAYLTNKRETKRRSILSVDNRSGKARNIHNSILRDFKRLSKYVGIEHKHESEIKRELTALVIKHIDSKTNTSKVILGIINNYILDDSYYILKLWSGIGSYLEGYETINLRSLIPNIKSFKYVSKHIRTLLTPIED